jgi:hypothetical protein
MTTGIEERPTHVHICEACGDQFECTIEDCELTDEDYIQCSACDDVDMYDADDTGEDYDN